jgi:hypothetical protein
MERPAEELQNTLAYLNTRLQYDDYELRPLRHGYQLARTQAHLRVADALADTAKSLDLDSVIHDFDRALEQAADDPEDAITSACSTVESVCKCLLDVMGAPYPKKQDVQGLVGEVQRKLNLAPDREDIGPDIKQILGGLATVAGGIGALRTHSGDAHGRGRGTARVDERIARLSIHAASTISLFLIETWQRMRATRPVMNT